MSDLVQRLRDKRLCISFYERDQIADRIEQLERTNQEWIAANGPGGWIQELRDHAKAWIATEQQNAELREALTVAMTWLDGEAWEMARAALSAANKGEKG